MDCPDKYFYLNTKFNSIKWSRLLLACNSFQSVWWRNWKTYCSWNINDLLILCSVRHCRWRVGHMCKMPQVNEKKRKSTLSPAPQQQLKQRFRSLVSFALQSSYSYMAILHYHKYKPSLSWPAGSGIHVDLFTRWPPILFEENTEGVTD